MELQPVESSHIAAIGYLEADRVLLVRYKDGALYAQAQFEAHEWAALQSAPSKGSWLYARDRKGLSPIRITQGGNAGNPSEPERHGAQQGAPLSYADWCKQFPGVTEKELQYCWDRKLIPNLPRTPLNVIDEDADPCCRKTFQAAEKSGIDGRHPIECFECGTQLVPQKIGVNVYWHIKPNMTIVSNRRFIAI